MSGRRYEFARRLLPQNKQVIVSSLTLSQETLDAASKLGRDTVCVLLKNNGTLSQGITHLRKVVTGKKGKTDEAKLEVICDLYKAVRERSHKTTMIVSSGRKKIDWVVQKASSRKIDIGPFSVMVRNVSLPDC